MASAKYWKVYDDYNGLLDDKAALATGEIPDLRTRTVLDVKVPKKAALRIV